LIRIEKRKKFVFKLYVKLLFKYKGIGIVFNIFVNTKRIYPAAG